MLSTLCFVYVFFRFVFSWVSLNANLDDLFRLLSFHKNRMLFDDVMTVLFHLFTFLVVCFCLDFFLFRSKSAVCFDFFDQMFNNWQLRTEDFPWQGEHDGVEGGPHDWTGSGSNAVVTEYPTSDFQSRPGEPEIRHYSYHGDWRWPSSLTAFPLSWSRIFVWFPIMFLGL